MTIEINKSTIVKTIIVVVVFILAIIGYQTYQSYKKATKEELASNLSKAGYLSAQILYEYSLSVERAKTSGFITDRNGESIIASSPENALEERAKHYQNIGISSYLDSLKNVMQKQMKKIDSNNEEDSAFTSAYESVSKLINYALTPSTTYFESEQVMNKYYTDFSISMDKIGVYYKLTPKDSVINSNIKFVQEKMDLYSQKRKNKD